MRRMGGVRGTVTGVGHGRGGGCGARGRGMRGVPRGLSCGNMWRGGGLPACEVWGMCGAEASEVWGACEGCPRSVMGCGSGGVRHSRAGACSCRTRARGRRRRTAACGPSCPAPCSPPRTSRTRPARRPPPPPSPPRGNTRAAGAGLSSTSTCVRRSTAVAAGRTAPPSGRLQSPAAIATPPRRAQTGASKRSVSSMVSHFGQSIEDRANVHKSIRGHSKQRNAIATLAKGKKTLQPNPISFSQFG